jgi:hypothetical protein
MSTVADILGLSRKPEVQVCWVKHYERLCGERDRLMARDCSTPEISRARMDDLGDAASEDCQTSVALVSTSATQDILAQVLDAIRRIERGTYGIESVSSVAVQNVIRFSRSFLALLEGEQVGIRADEQVPFANPKLRHQLHEHRISFLRFQAHFKELGLEFARDEQAIFRRVIRDAIEHIGSLPVLSDRSPRTAFWPAPGDDQRSNAVGYFPPPKPSAKGRKPGRPSLYGRKTKLRKGARRSF